MIEQFVFYFFGGTLLLSSVMVVTVRNSVHAALFLVFTFFSSSVILLLLRAEFLAITLVLVYVGAVMVLFLFVVMMLDVDLAKTKEGFTRHLYFGVIVSIFMAVLIGLVVGTDYFASDNFKNILSINQDQSNTRELGFTIYTQYLYQFEIAGAILLVAIIAAISLSVSKLKIKKTQNPGEQVLAKKEDRLRIIKMSSENHD